MGSPPGDPWAFLSPEPSRFGEFWQCRCPLGCGGLIDLLEPDHEVTATWTIGGPCTRGCEVTAMAERLALATLRPMAEFMQPIVLTAELQQQLTTMIATVPAVSGAWHGTHKFQTTASRIAALGLRMREAGATSELIAVGQAVLAANLAKAKP